MIRHGYVIARPVVARPRKVGLCPRAIVSKMEKNLGIWNYVGSILKLTDFSEREPPVYPLECCMVAREVPRIIRITVCNIEIVTIISTSGTVADDAEGISSFRY